MIRNRHLNVANRDELLIHNISMVNSEDYFSDTNRFAEYNEPLSDEDWEFRTQPILDEEEPLELTNFKFHTLNVKDVFYNIPIN